MTPQGEFVTRRPETVWAMRLGLGAALVAVVAAGLVLAAVFLWVASVLIPVALVAGVVAYGALRYQMWRARGRKLRRSGPLHG